ncbi:MAG: hypothetical protein ACFBSC_12010 [Microcoleaceae cyanobacterium]
MTQPCNMNDLEHLYHQLNLVILQAEQLDQKLIQTNRCQQHQHQPRHQADPGAGMRSEQLHLRKLSRLFGRLAIIAHEKANHLEGLDLDSTDFNSTDFNSPLTESQTVNCLSISTVTAWNDSLDWN